VSLLASLRLPPWALSMSNRTRFVSSCVGSGSGFRGRPGRCCRLNLESPFSLFDLEIIVINKLIGQ